jgi:beta-lactamase regulating signal transducer with metallopeptidase domain
MDAVHAANILTWALQVAVISSAGALLASIAGARHARVRLLYCYAVMLAAILLPAFQPFEDTMMLTTVARPQGDGAREASPLSLPPLLLAAMAGGVLVRLIWIGAGFVQLWKLRRSALPLEKIPESLRCAVRLVGVHAAFRVSGAIRSPAALGHVDPVILVPPSFASLSERAQHTIAVHELLHVQRHDWLKTVFEQCLTALLWFSPGIWWLVAEARLCREEIIDAQVVAWTSQKVPYVDALLSFAGVKASFKPLPAAQFFSRRQLSHRMRALIVPQRCSAGKLALSYSAMAAAVVIFALASFVLFPLQGRTEVFSARQPLMSPVFFKPLMTASVATASVATASTTAELSAMRSGSRRLQANGAAPQPEWDMAIPADTIYPQRDMLFVVNRLHSIEDSIPSPGVFVPAGIAAIRAIPVGAAIPPAEIERLLSTIPVTHRVEITQDSQHRITRIVMGQGQIRRTFSDETTRFILRVPVDAIHDDAAAAADPADGVD